MCLLGVVVVCPCSRIYNVSVVALAALFFLDLFTYPVDGCVVRRVVCSEICRMNEEYSVLLLIPIYLTEGS